MIILLVLVPLLGSLVVLSMPKNQTAWIRRTGVGCCAINFFLSLFFIFCYNASKGGIQFEVFFPWVPSLGIGYHAGLDGISVVMILLHSLVSLSGSLVSYSIKERVKEYYIFYLLLVASIFGVFSSWDLFFLYFFYEMAVIPMYPLIGIWGSKNKEYATMKLTLYITGGAVLALVGILALYQVTGLKTFDVLALKDQLAQNPLPKSFQIWATPLLIFGFGVIASLWPTHSWSPIGYAAAPSAVSMIHAGVLKKLGPYLMIRTVLSLMPYGARFWFPLVATFCVINILYAGYCAMVQRDLKFMIGFSSVSHMGYVLLGLACLNETALTGAVLLMFSHGVMAALAFALIGTLYDQTHTRMIDELGGGLAKKVPFLAFCFVMTSMASLGLPGFSNFIAEIMIFFGAWKTFLWQTVAAVFGILVTAVYLLRAIRKVFFGRETVRRSSLKDAVTFFERIPYALLLSALLIFGFFPGLLVHKIETGVRPLTDQILTVFQSEKNSPLSVWNFGASWPATAVPVVPLERYKS